MTRPTPVGGIHVVDYPACTTVGNPDVDFADVARGQASKIHKQLWRADAPTSCKWAPPAVPQDAHIQARVRKMIAAAIAGEDDRARLWRWTCSTSSQQRLLPRTRAFI